MNTMINLLFDFISLQNYHSGGGEYVRKIFERLLCDKHINIYGIYDSNIRFLDNDYDELAENVPLLDINLLSISEMIEKYGINIFFIGIGQRYNSYNLCKITCKVVCVIHDIGNIEITQNHIFYLYNHSCRNLIKILMDYWMAKSRFSPVNKILKQYENIRTLLLQDNVTVVTVSHYTRSSLLFYFPELSRKHICILYPPVKRYQSNLGLSAENKALYSFLNIHKKYILFVNANRENKNYLILKKCFLKLKMKFPDLYLIVTGMKQEAQNSDILFLNHVTNADIELLYKNAWALIYSSWTEGFGYPPVEALKYATPVISSNVCSMPEVLEDSVIYFSPLYENDLYNKVLYLNDNYLCYSEKGLEQYKKINRKQNDDFEFLINNILQSK